MVQKSFRYDCIMCLPFEQSITIPLILSTLACQRVPPQWWEVGRTFWTYITLTSLRVPPRWCGVAGAFWWFWNTSHWDQLLHILEIFFRHPIPNLFLKYKQDVFVKHRWPRQQQSTYCIIKAKISKSYIMTPPHPKGHMMSLKCEQPLHTITFQIWSLYVYPNFRIFHFV